jgi:hypothetical protein
MFKKCLKNVFLKMFIVYNMEMETIKKMYENLNYFDQYGGSVLLFIIITIIVFLLISYCFVMINTQPIIDDWVNQRCKPNIMPFAGYITRPDGMTAREYTYQNFNYCTQNILSNMTGMAVEPLTFVISSLNNMSEQLKTDIQNSRGMFNKIRNMFQTISQEIMGRIVNFIVPLQQIIISFKDLISKIQGSLTAGLFTLLGSYYTLKSLMGSIAELILKILVALAAMIAVMWAIPLTWGVAATNTAIFVAISIPLMIILIFMKDVLHIQTKMKIPKVKLKCFDSNTYLTMNDGTQKKIIDIVVGDLLMDNNKVTSTFIVETKGSIMYKLGNIIVSDSHLVKYNNKWISVSKHPNAVRQHFYNNPYLYCLNTFQKIIKIENYLFTDWDEIIENTFTRIINKYNNIKNNINDTKDLHTYLDCGFEKHTIIKLQNGSFKEIQNINIEDILENGEKIYGLVKINGATMNKQFKYNLGKNTFIEGKIQGTGCKKMEIQKHDILYHLLTDTKYFYIDSIKFCDYNGVIDSFLE